MTETETVASETETCSCCGSAMRQGVAVGPRGEVYCRTACAQAVDVEVEWIQRPVQKGVGRF